MPSLLLAARYTSRSLRRGGQRTVLALFCIAVGVMAVVALRLAGDMITVSITSNLREVLGGDISVQSNSVPLTRDQLSVFDSMKSSGAIQDYAALGTFNATIHRQGGNNVPLQLFVVDDPAHYPLVAASALQEPSNVTESQAIATSGNVLLGGFTAEQLSAHAGDSVDIGIARNGGGGTLTVGGVLAPRVTAGNPSQAYISRATYQALGGGSGAAQFGLVQVVVGGSSQDTENVAAQIRAALPQTNTTTVKDALDQATQSSQDVNSALEVTGMLALLIGGVGVANTMQVSLRRRRVEVAMLKTAGYRRTQLITLFGLEAACLGIGGGVLGTLLGIGVADVVRILVQRAFYIDVPLTISGWTLASGLVVGLVTALIFGLLPIVRSAAVRPVVVLRDEALTPTLTSASQTALLYGVLLVAFTALAASVINNVGVALIVVAVGIVLLGLASGGFWLVVWLVGLIPVLERPRVVWAFFSVVAVAVTVALGLWLGAIGWVLTALTIANLVLVAMPRPVKTAVKLALRSLRRTRLRTATTLVALFSGVAAIGLILVIGQDVGNKLSAALESLSGYEVYTVAGPQDSAKLLTETQKLPGLTSRRVVSDIATQPQSVDGRSIQSIAAQQQQAQRQEVQANPGAGREGLRIGSLAGVEGYDMVHGQVPDAGIVFPGRPLDTQDAGTGNVLVRTDLERQPYNLRLGSTIVLTQPSSAKSVTVTVAGFYTQARVSANGVRIRIFLQPIIADSSVVDTLAGSGQNPDLQTAVAVGIDPAQHDAAIQQLEHAIPRVYILDIAAFAQTAQHILSNLVDLLIALAMLSVVAGIVIIANTVALAMLERRREIGILKAVGHDRRSVLAQVIVENAVVGAIGGLAGILAVAVAARELQDHLIPIDLPVSASIVLGCAGGLVVLVILTATLVAWGPLRVRPVEVLRYE